MSDIREAIEQVGGPSLVARRMGVAPQTVCSWIARDRVPASRVLDYCRAVDWQQTPHQVAPHIYPNPLDGLPVRAAA